MTEIATWPPLMTTAQVAAYYQVTTRTVRNWVRRGFLVPVRRARTVRFRREEIIVDDGLQKQAPDETVEI